MIHCVPTSQVNTASLLWSSIPDESLRWAEWNDQYVVYHEDSGDAHQLNQIAALSLQHLTRQGMASDDLANTVARSLDIDADDAFRTSVEQALAGLRRIGLVVSAHA